MEMKSPSRRRQGIKSTLVQIEDLDEGWFNTKKHQLKLADISYLVLHYEYIEKY
jgi:hypothetical protein